VPKYVIEKTYPANGKCDVSSPPLPCPKPGCRTKCDGEEAMMAHIAKHKRGNMVAQGRGGRRA
jgi:hypothetical protein